MSERLFPFLSPPRKIDRPPPPKVVVRPAPAPPKVAVRLAPAPPKVAVRLAPAPPKVAVRLAPAPPKVAVRPAQAPPVRPKVTLRPPLKAYPYGFRPPGKEQVDHDSRLEKAVEAAEFVNETADWMENAGWAANKLPASVRQRITAQAPRLVSGLTKATTFAAKRNPQINAALQSIDLARLAFDPSYRQSAIDSLDTIADNPIPILDNRIYNSSTALQAIDRAPSTIYAQGAGVGKTTPWVREAKQEEADQKYTALKQHTEQWIRDRQNARAAEAAQSNEAASAERIRRELIKRGLLDSRGRDRAGFA